MAIFQAIKELIFWEKDDEFFDKEATIKEYFAVCPPEQRRHVSSYDELFTEALRYVAKQNFKENTKNQEDYFYEMDEKDAVIAILTGAFAYIIACEVDKRGKKLEGDLDKLLPKGYDTNNPFDTRKGYGHRDFGHDIFGFGVKNISSDFIICVDGIEQCIGDVVGKSGDVSMADLIWFFYGENAKSPLAGVFNCIGHTVVHFAKDLLTAEGVPLPFSSLLNDYKTSYIDDLGYDDDDLPTTQADTPIIKGELNKKLKEYSGDMRASDFASLIFIQGMCKAYSTSKKLGDKEKSFNRDLKIIAMGTCIMIQMSSLILNSYEKGGKRGKSAMIPGAKLNVIMTSALIKNMVQEMAVVIKERHGVNVEYDAQLKEIQKRIDTYE